jgi:uncharacterized membrane-anchored protein
MGRGGQVSPGYHESRLRGRPQGRHLGSETGNHEGYRARILINEVHARPFAQLSTPQRASHLALLTGEDPAEDRAQVAALCAAQGAPPPGPEDTYLMADLGPFRLRWERHTEFSSYTFYQDPGAPGFDAAAAPFAAPPLDGVPRDWLATLPGQLLVGVHLELEARDAPQRDEDALARLFGTDNTAGSVVSGGAGAVWMDFAVQADGFGRVLLQDRGLRPRQAGRLVQRLFEIETYRMLALLALPLARRYGPELSRSGARLTEMTARLAAIEGLEDERRLLGELTRMSAEVEDMAATASYRFAAARAYHDLVRRRVTGLREERFEGMQTIGEFLGRRLAPAMATCEAVAARLEGRSDRVSRASQLLRTRIDIALEAQNGELLRSMDRRARLQLRLQQTVEGLSVAAISYYLVGLVGYAAKAAKAAGVALDADLATGLSIPVVVGLVGFGVWRLRRLVARDARTPDL